MNKNRDRLKEQEIKRVCRLISLLCVMVVEGGGEEALLRLGLSELLLLYKGKDGCRKGKMCE